MKQIALPHHVIVALICALLLCTVVTAQQQTAPQTDKPSVPKVEIGAQFSQVYFNNFGKDFGNADTSLGFGGRVTYNLTDHLAVEAEANFSPFAINADFSNEFVVGGRALQAQFGVKAGKRFRHFGIFAKARPGFVSFGETLDAQLGSSFIGFDGSEFFDVNFSSERKTHFALDVGGVFEVYASRRLFARFDAGDTMLRYGRHREADFSRSGSNVVFIAPARTQHYLQISAGVGVRLGSHGDDNSGAAAGASAPRPNKATRFEAGAQFTSLSFNSIGSPTGEGFIFDPREKKTEPGFGGRFTYNLTRYFAFEAETNLLPRKFSLTIGASGRVTQGLFGIKAGHRFHSFGIFGKARPGFVSFGSSFKQVGLTPPLPNPFNDRLVARGIFEFGRRTFFAADLGGVFELYPSRRWLVRFDGGDTIIHYGERSVDSFFTAPPIIVAPPETRHNFQFSTGVGFRF
jgi:hypothetical protein